MTICGVVKNVRYGTISTSNADTNATPLSISMVGLIGVCSSSLMT